MLLKANILKYTIFQDFMERKIIRAKIDLRRVCSYSESEFDNKISGDLLKTGLFSDDYVYTIFNHGRAKQVAKSGLTIHPSEDIFYAFKKNQLVWDNGNSNCLKVCVNQVSLNPGIAVYNLNGLKKAYLANSEFGYEFKDKSKALESLVGIARIILP